MRPAAQDPQPSAGPVAAQERRHRELTALVRPGGQARADTAD